jgi:transcriptional regulator with XRE-family HTH domain
VAKERIGVRIREARAAKGWKQKELAAQVDVEPITVSRWERGATTPDLDVLGLVADATGRPLSYFVGPANQAPAEDDDRLERLEQRLDRLERAVGRLLDRLEQ